MRAWIILRSTAMSGCAVSSEMRVLILFVLALLCGCTDTADTFPMNDAARRIGRLQVSFVRTGVGRGPITITMPDGEIATGTWRVAFDGGVGMAFSGGKSATALAIGNGNVQFVAHGPTTEILCRGTSSPFGGGSGECQTYEGAVWGVSW
jgi:hypothetical protein